MANRRQEIPDAVRYRVFDAALAVMAERGVDDFDVAAVARRADVSEQLIGRQWPGGSRVLLMEAMLTRANDAVPIPDTGSLGGDVRQFADSLAELTDTTMGREWFRRLVPGGPDADLSHVADDFLAFEMASVERIFHRAAERGELRSDIDHGKAARMVSAALVYDMVFHDSPIDRDYAEQVSNILLHGTLTSDNSELLEDFHASEQTRALLRATCDAVIDPIALVEAVRDDDGHIVDFVFREINPAACTSLQHSRAELVGATVTDTLPDLVASGLLTRYIQAMETQAPLEVEDFPFFSRRFHTMRRFELGGQPASRDWLSVIWRDVSERHRSQQQAVIAERVRAARAARAGASPEELAEIEAAEAVRAASDALLDPQVLLEAVRDPSGQITDFFYAEVNQATCDYLGLSREDVIGRGVVETMPGPKAELLAEFIRCVETGEPLIVNDFPYDNKVLQGTRRYDVRVTRASARSVTLTWRDVTDRFEAARDLARSRDLLRASADAMFNPQALVEVVTTGSEEADLVLRDVNRAFCDNVGQERSGLLGQSLVALFPNVVGAGPLALYVRCAETGEPVILDDVEYVSESDDKPRYVDVRATQVDSGLITVTFRDTTARYEAARHLARSERNYRLLAENTADVITRVRDGRFLWVSPAVNELLGAPAESWIGRELREIVPAEDVPALEEAMATLEAGGAIQRRARLKAVDGVTHWVHINSKPYYDESGRQDGFTASVRSIDTEVAAETAAEEAHRQQARADALYRRSMDNAAVGMCLADTEGNFVEVNGAICEFFGYEPAVLQQMTWLELTAPEYLEPDLAKRAEVLAGDIDSYRLTKQFIHADGHRIWGDLAVSCIRDGAGQVELFIGQITDTTARVEAEQRITESEERYRLLAEHTTNAVIHGRNGKFVWVSPAIEGILGAPPQYWNGRDLSEMVPPGREAAFAEGLELLEAGGTLQRRGQVVCVDGTIHWIHVHAAPFRNADGQMDGFIASLRVIDDEVAAETAAAEARRRQARADALYRRSMESAAVGMCLARPEGQILQVNQALSDFFGYDADTLLQKTWMELTAQEYLQAELDHVADVVAGRTDNYRMVKQYVHADGHRLWGDLSVGCLRREDGSVEVLIKQIADITAQVNAEQRLERLARVDTLTGLANRGEVIARLESALEPTRGRQSHVGVLYCDVDGFKGINDTLGHGVGDVVLSTLASRIRHCVRDGDTVGRVGGDEILVLLPGLHNLDEVTRIAEKIRRQAGESLVAGTQTVTVTLSIGAVLATPGQTTSTVLARADAAMYQAKIHRNAVSSYTGTSPSQAPN